MENIFMMVGRTIVNALWRVPYEWKAYRLGIEGYQSMSNEELKQALERAPYERQAQELEIEGYQNMNNDELQNAITRKLYERLAQICPIFALLIFAIKQVHIFVLELTPTEIKEPCSICLDTPIQAVATLCKHTFHEECIQEWSKNKNTCPLCRQSLYKNSSLIEA